MQTSDITWILEFGETDHMTACLQFFSSYTPYADDKKVKIVDGSLSAIAWVGTVHLSPNFIVHNVLHVPKLSCNLISVSKITSDLTCRVNFFPTFCEFSDLISGKMIGNSKEHDGLYLFEDRDLSWINKALVVVVFFFFLFGVMK